MILKFFGSLRIIILLSIGRILRWRYADQFFTKMKSMDGVRLPGERRHKNRLDKGPRHINADLENKVKTLSK